MADGLLSKIKYLFMFCNTIVLALAIFGFIWGNINYENNWIDNGSFIGGQLASICIAFMIYALFGLYGAYKNHYFIIASYGVIGLVSMVLRIVTWMLAWFHGYNLNAWYYVYLSFELVIVILVLSVLSGMKPDQSDN